MNRYVSKKKVYVYTSFQVIGILLILYYLILKLMFGFVAFSNMFCMLGILLFVYGYVELKFNIDIQKLGILYIVISNDILFICKMCMK